MLTFSPLLSGQNDQDECGFDPSPFELQLMKEAIDKAYSEPQFLAKLDDMDTLICPIRVTVFRNDEGTLAAPGGGLHATQEEVTLALSQVNDVFKSLKFQFFQEGPINFVDNSRVTETIDFEDGLLSFTSSTAHLQLFSNAANAGSVFHFPDNTPQGNYYGRKGNGPISLDRRTLFNSFLHEMGHVFATHHTWGGRSLLYDNPYDPIENSPMIFEDVPSRELVIREELPDGTANYTKPNHKSAGDRISDTPAWGTGGPKYPDPNDPDCFVYVDSLDGFFFGGVRNCSSGIHYEDCNYTGNYVDYNGHELINTDVAISNFMSYTPSSCQNSFTEDQHAVHHRKIREDAARVWDPSKGEHFVDSVQLWHTTVPVQNTNILFSHKKDTIADGRYSQVTSSVNGSFGAKLFDSSVKAKAVFLGRGLKNPDYLFWSDTSYVMYDYNEADWTLDITTADIMSLTKHILGTEEFNPFQKLAADVNRDGELDLSDLIGIRRLILGLDTEFEDYPSGPWQFVPEVVSQDPSFLGDPFNMLIDGISYSNEAPYIKSDFFFTPVLGEASGFDAYKLGDINGSSMDRLSEGITPAQNCSKEGKAEIINIASSAYFGNKESLVYQVSPTASKDISGFQVEIEYDNTKLELQDKQVVLGGDLVQRAAAEIGNPPPSSGLKVNRWGNEIVDGPKTQLRLSYIFNGGNSNFSQKIHPTENMMELVFKTKTAGINMSEAIKASSGIPFEVYQADGCVIKEDFTSRITKKEKSFSGTESQSTYGDFSMSISPNPVADRTTLVIKSPLDEKYEVVFYSMTTGQKISTFSAETTGGYFYGKIDTEDFPKDVILVKVKGPQTSYSTKLIKL